MDELDFRNHLESLTHSVDQALCKSLPPDSELVAMMRYSLLAPGKRIRPVLALASAEMLHVSTEAVLPFAVALEHIHASSLVHDDLPALDNDTLRRGQPTAHIRFGEAQAILTGDALLARAFALVSGEQVSPEAAPALTRILADSVHELCEGQLLDLTASATGQGASGQELASLRTRHMKKTAALIVAALVGPAYFRPTNEQSALLPALQAFGSHLGLLFQITDDVLDATATTAALGKSAAADVRQGTPTYVSELGVNRARELAHEHAAAAKQALAPFKDRARFLSWLVDQVLTRNK